MARAAAKTHRGKMLELRYEDLLTGPEQPLADAFEFLGVESSPAAVQAALKAADFERLSEGRKRGEEDSGSFFRKGVAGEWRKAYPAETLAAFNEIAGETLAAYGYEI